MTRPRALLLYLAIASSVVVVDLWTKHAVFQLVKAEFVEGIEGFTLNRSGPQIEIIPGKLALEAAINPGAFNGMFAGVSWLLLGVSAAWVLGTLVFVACYPAQPLLLVAVSLTAGGAFGNLYDRICFGAVRDFVKIYHGQWVWPNFNIADSCICVGVGLIILREFLLARQVKRAADPDPTAPKAAVEETP